MYLESRELTQYLNDTEISGNELERRAELSKGQVSQIRTGKIRITIKTYSRMHPFVGFSPAVLVGIKARAKRLQERSTGLSPHKARLPLGQVIAEFITSKPVYNWALPK